MVRLFAFFHGEADSKDDEGLDSQDDEGTESPLFQSPIITFVYCKF